MTPRQMAAKMLASKRTKGWRLIEIRAAITGDNTTGKHPVLKGWPTAAQTDPSTWDKRSNLGVVCGEISGVVVVDIDGEEGLETFKAAQKELGPLPEGPSQETGGGGRHLFFRYTEALANLSNRTGFRHKMDFKTTGGYVVLAPSRHHSGNSYSWRVAPSEARLPELPAAWIKVLATPNKRPLQPYHRDTIDFAKWLDKQPGCIAGNNGQGDLMRIARKAVRDAGMRDLDAFVTLVHASKWNREKCLGPDGEPYPWTKRELEKKFGDALARYESEGLADIPCDKDGKRYCSYMDLMRIFREDVLLAGQFRFNTLGRFQEWKGQRLDDAAILRLRTLICERYGYGSLGADKVTELVTEACSQNPYNPVAAYLDGLVWDGKPRLDLVAAGILGNETPLAAVQVRKWFIAAAARGLDPGADVQHILILYSPIQNIGKSTFFRVLGGEWFSETVIDLHNKDAYDLISQVWILEWSEFEVLFKTADQAAIKNFLSKRYDDFRPSHERKTIRSMRPTAFGASSNSKDLIHDRTGSRRYWIVPVHGVTPEKKPRLDIDLLRKLRDQLWAEATHAYRAGEDWKLTVEEDDEREIEAEVYKPEAPLYEKARQAALEWPEEWLTFAAICRKLQIHGEGLSPLLLREISEGVQASGYEKKRRRRSGGGLEMGYQRAAKPDRSP